jgi:hypothetical protein
MERENVANIKLLKSQLMNFDAKNMDMLKNVQKLILSKPKKENIAIKPNHCML